jgi:imidazolonepropionase-like amidohydrolase
MPGLMDMHTPDVAALEESYTERSSGSGGVCPAARRCMLAARCWRALPRFATGDNGVNAIALRKAINEGWSLGADLHIGQIMATTGGHHRPEQRCGVLPPRPRSVEGDQRSDARAVRQRYKDARSDQAHSRRNTEPGRQRTARNSPMRTPGRCGGGQGFNMTVAVHAHGAGNEACRAGGSRFDRAWDVYDRRGHQLMRKGTYWVPTNMAGSGGRSQDPDYFPAVVRAKAERSGGDRDVSQGAGRGVKIAFGTDSGVSAQRQCGSLN